MACQALIREADTESGGLRLKFNTEAAAHRRLHAQRKLTFDTPRTAQLDRQRNRQSAIDKLPIECFSEILYQSLVGGRPEARVRRLRGLACVSTYWRDLVASTSRLWSLVSQGMPLKDVELALKQSKVDSLEVITTSHACRTGLQEFTAAVIPHASRWRCLRVSSDVDGILSCLGSSASRLEDLYVESRGANQARTLDLCEGLRLRNIIIGNIAVPWDSTRLAGLKQLHIECLTKDQLPSLVQLTTILGSSAGLTSLKLAGLDIRSEGWMTKEDVQQRIPIDLPNLRRLEISRVPYRSYIAIMPCLRFQNCETIKLEPDQLPEMMEDESALHSAFDHAGSDFVVGVTSSLRGQKEVDITVTKEGITILAGSWSDDEPDQSGFRLHLKISQGKRAIFYASMNQVFRLLAAACPDADVCLHLKDVDGYEDPSDEESLGALINLRKLILTGDVGGYVAVYLGTRLEGTSGRIDWPCPRLQTIDFRGVTDAGAPDIRRVVKSRWQKNKETEGDCQEGLIDVFLKRVGTEKWRPVKERKAKR